MNKEYMDSRTKHIRFLVGSAMHKVMETICWCTPSITKHKGSEVMGAHEIHLQTTTEGVTHLYEAIDALQDACRRFSFFEVEQAVLSDPVLKFYTADTRKEETFEERVLRETEEQLATQAPSVAVEAKPEPQPPKPKPKPATAKKSGSHSREPMINVKLPLATLAVFKRRGEMATFGRQAFGYALAHHRASHVYPPLDGEICKNTGINVPVKVRDEIYKRAGMLGVKKTVYAGQMFVSYAKIAIKQKGGK